MRWHSFFLTRLERPQLPGDLPGIIAPRVARGVRWGLCSGLEFGIHRTALVGFPDMTDKEAADLESVLLNGESYAGAVFDQAEGARLDTALRTVSPAFERWKTARANPQRPDETERLARELRAFHDAPLADWGGAVAAFARPFEQSEARAIYGLTRVTSDGFSGANGTEVNGRALDLAFGGSADSWTVNGGNGLAEINTARLHSLSGGAVSLYAGTMADLADGEVSLTGQSGGWGPTGRINPATGAGYLAWNDRDAYKAAAWGGWGSIASGANVGAAGDVIVLRMTGTTIARVFNGAVDGSAVDATYATGKAGVFLYSSGTADAFLVDSSAGPPPVTSGANGLPSHLASPRNTHARNVGP